MREREFRTQVVKAARERGWIVYFAPDQPTNRNGGPGRAGFPDLFMYHTLTNQVLAMELKTDTGELTREQYNWLMALGEYLPAVVVRPGDDWLDLLTPRFHDGGVG